MTHNTKYISQEEYNAKNKYSLFFGLASAVGITISLAVILMFDEKNIQNAAGAGMLICFLLGVFFSRKHAYIYSWVIEVFLILSFIHATKAPNFDISETIFITFVLWMFSRAFVHKFTLKVQKKDS
jgi:hypothetical protein